MKPLSHRTECAIEALGKIGVAESYNSLLAYVMEHPESALISLIPLANTGKKKSVKKSVKYIRHFLNDEMSILRQTAVKALSSIGSEECLQALKERLCDECDEKVRNSILQAIHSVESALIREMDIEAHQDITELGAKNIGHELGR
jgi:hypothetical protein